MIVVWLVLIVVFIIIECFRTNVTGICLAIGALPALVISCVGLPIWVSIACFIVISFLLFAFVRPVIKRKFDKSNRQARNKEIVGMRGLVTSQIDNLRGIGLVRANNREWSAFSKEQNVIIPEGAIVKILALRGDKLMVRLDESLENNIELRTSDALLDPKYYE